MEEEDKKTRQPGKQFAKYEQSIVLFFSSYCRSKTSWFKDHEIEFWIDQRRPIQSNRKILTKSSSQKHAVVGHSSYQSHRLLNYGHSLEHLCDHNRLNCQKTSLLRAAQTIRSFPVVVFHLQNNCLSSSSQVCSIFIKHLPVILLEISNKLGVDC